VSTLALLLLLPLLLAGWFWLMQPRMVFFPVRELAATPQDWGMPYQDVSLRTRDGIQLHGWYIPHAGASHTLLFLHGNAGNISHRGDSLRIFHRLGLNVLILDYRGYGRSEGRPSEAGLYQDAEAGWRYLMDERGLAPGQVVLFGRSLGAVVAAWLAARLEGSDGPAALIMESGFSSAADVARDAYPLLHWLVPLRYRFDATAQLRKVRCPVLVLHSVEDEIIPFALGDKLYSAANPPKRLWRMQGDHNGGFLLSQPEYEHALAAFLSEIDAD
jgi:fermentation-respiration switch protein FrsA (DUF1100 family)